ncbi:hypothetical protein MTO96_035185 [Rhipicephalus appendiculatus]
MSISDSDNDTIFDCLSANRTEIDYEAQTFSYVWTIQGEDESVQWTPLPWQRLVLSLASLQPELLKSWPRVEERKECPEVRPTIICVGTTRFRWHGKEELDVCWTTCAVEQSGPGLKFLAKTGTTDSGKGLGRTFVKQPTLASAVTGALWSGGIDAISLGAPRPFGPAGADRYDRS